MCPSPRKRDESAAMDLMDLPWKYHTLPMFCCEVIFKPSLAFDQCRVSSSKASKGTRDIQFTSPTSVLASTMWFNLGGVMVIYIYIYIRVYIYISYIIFIYKVNHRLVSTTLLAKSKHLWVTTSLISAQAALRCVSLWSRPSRQANYILQQKSPSIPHWSSGCKTQTRTTPVLVGGLMRYNGIQ